MDRFGSLHRKIVWTGSELADRLFFANTRESIRGSYDVQTSEPAVVREKDEDAFARLMRLESADRVLHYRVCLYDDEIIRFLDENVGTDMLTFIVYIMTHELLHIDRIRKGLADFDSSSHEEEVIVDNLTRIFMAKFPVTGRSKVIRLLDNLAPPPLYNQRTIIDNGGIFDAYL